MKEYELTIPGLEEAVAACTPAPGHKTLVKALERLPGLADVRLAITRGEEGGSYLATRGVYAPDGTRLHGDHEAWLRQEAAADGGDARTTFYRLQGKGYQLSRTHVATLYLVIDHGGDQANFDQLEVRQEHERMECELFKDRSLPPEKIAHLLSEAEGCGLPEAQRVSVAPARYRLQRAVNILRFVEVVERIEAEQGEAPKQRVDTPPHSAGESEQKTHAQVDPGFDRYPHKARRLFNDWAASSAGRSGARLCEHWAMRLSDWIDPRTNARRVGLVPLWTFGQKLAEVDAYKGDAGAFYGKLQTLDHRVGVPFGWYFFMLHGDRVHDGAGHRVLKEVEKGLIVLVEHDYQVLRAWRERPYGFTGVRALDS
jgi:hypothetical protein